MKPAADNWCALLTPPGAAAISVVRVCGPAAVDIVDAVFRMGHGRGPLRAALANGTLRYGEIVDGEEVVDDVLVSLAGAGLPASSVEAGAGEAEPLAAAVDICTHGGVRVVERVLELLTGRGAPLRDEPAAQLDAWPAADRLQRELNASLMRVTTLRGVRFLAWQRQHLERHLRGLAESAGRDPAHARREIGILLDRFPPARVLIEGGRVVFTGPVNSGKSTLFNTLLGRAAAVVSSRAGTTRDWVSAEAEIEGAPLTLVDTAGHHLAAGALEQLAIDAGRRQALDADVRVVVFDGAADLPPHAVELLAAGGAGGRLAVAITKCDLGTKWKVERLHQAGVSASIPMVRVSSTTGAGLAELAGVLLGRLGLGGTWKDDAPALFTARQADAVRSLSDEDDAAGAGIRSLIVDALLGGAGRARSPRER
ncbi:MAG: 50S ribosome-binding GTPase [Planctomycetes bacterium]|nr:50S ribosome-binding GTPase [Planctomycetota bacterium]